MGLAVVCSHFNPGGFRAPRRNLLRFLRQMRSQGIPTFVAELSYDDDPFFLPDNPCYFRFRSERSNVLWHKENLLNLAVNLSPDHHDKIAWIDPDVFFFHMDWVRETEQKLESHAAVQLFTEVQFTDEDGVCYKRKSSAIADRKLRLGYNQPGFAWAANRDLWRKAGGLCELAILGGGDTLFTCACLNTDAPTWMHYPDWKIWTACAKSWVQNAGGAGVVAGTIVHEWHGSDKDRAYIERHSLLRNLRVNELVVKRDDGLLEFTETVPASFRRSIYDYFIGRSEDSALL